MGEKLGGKNSPNKTAEKVFTPAKKSGDYLAEYEEMKRGFERMKKSLEYKFMIKPNKPTDCDIKEIDNEWWVVGFNKKEGADSFCFGKKVGLKNELGDFRDYRYLSQKQFYQMIEKLKEILAEYTKATTTDPSRNYMP